MTRSLIISGSDGEDNGAWSGRGVNLKAEKEDPEKKKLIDKGWKDNAYNQ